MLPIRTIDLPRKVQALQRKCAAMDGLHITTAMPPTYLNEYYKPPVIPSWGMSLSLLIQLKAASMGLGFYIRAWYSATIDFPDRAFLKVAFARSHRRHHILRGTLMHRNLSRVINIETVLKRYQITQAGDYLWLEIRFTPTKALQVYLDGVLMIEIIPDDRYMPYLAQYTRYYHPKNFHNADICEFHWTHAGGTADNIFPTNGQHLKNMFLPDVFIAEISAGGTIVMRGKFVIKNAKYGGIVIELVPVNRNGTDKASYIIDRDPNEAKEETILVTVGGTDAHVIFDGRANPMNLTSGFTGMNSYVISLENFVPTYMHIKAGMKILTEPWTA